MRNDESIYLGRQDPPEQPSNNFLARLIANAKPLVILAGPAQPPRDNLPIRKVLGDDPQLLAMTEHVRNKKEKMFQFYARVGLGPSQIRTMSKAEISHFVEVVSQQERGFENPAHFEPRAMPKKLMLDI